MSVPVSAPVDATQRDDVQRSAARQRLDEKDKREITIIDGRVNVSTEYYSEMRDRALEMRDKFTAGQSMEILMQRYGGGYSAKERKALGKVVWHIVHSTGIMRGGALG